MIRISVALACCLLASGCVSIGSYPDGSLLLHVSYGMSVMMLQWPIFPAVASGWIRFPEVAASQE
jgi:uncharacterized protein YceK